MEYEIEIENPEKLFIPKHKDLLNLDQFSILFLWGGRYGAKSEDIARMLVFKCLMLQKFKCVLARKVFNTIQDSSFATIKDFVDKYNLNQFFKFTKSPLKIECTNGNSFLCRGFDKPEKVKSIKDPTHFWIEELAECDLLDFETALTTLRGSDIIQLIGTFNPESDLPKQDFWIYNKFFSRPEKDFEDDYIIKLENRDVKFKFKSIHTTYKDNPYLDDRQRAIVENYKREFELTGSAVAEYYYLVWTLGEFGDKLPEMPYLHEFSSINHVLDIPFNPSHGLHVTLDMNVNPYLPGSIWQFIDYKFYQTYEIILKHPHNRTTNLANEIVKYADSVNYRGIIYIYGDATAKKDDTNQEVGTNFFTIIESIIRKKYKTELRVPGLRTNKIKDMQRARKNPNRRNSGEFANEIIKAGRCFIDTSCIYSINDYKNAKKDADGGIDKKEKDKATGGQKYGHNVDCLRYLFCEVLYEEYKNYTKVKTRLL
jgi:PBSX family phage terminase large subunit